jgi:hypothetical protein
MVKINLKYHLATLDPLLLPPSSHLNQSFNTREKIHPATRQAEGTGKLKVR